MRSVLSFVLGVFVSLTSFLAAEESVAAPVRLWTELAGLKMGSTPSAVSGGLRGAKLKAQKLRGKKNRGQSALTEKVVFERHSPASAVYRFAGDALYEVELRYAKKGRQKRMASFLQKKFGNCKKKGKTLACRAGDRAVVFRSPGGKVAVTFTSPAVLAAFQKANAPKKKVRAEEAEEGEGTLEPPISKAAARAKARAARIAAKEAAAAELARKKRAGRVIAERKDDPKLWDVLGVKTGPVRVFETQLRRKGRAELVAAGFRRAGAAPLAAILSSDDDGYELHHLGPACGGTPDEARAIDFRLEGKADVALYSRSGNATAVALIPFDQRFAGAKFIGGRFGGKNAYRCYELGEDALRIDFVDIDHDKSIDLLLTYQHPGAGQVHDVYFFQGNDFYFRETRPGAPRPAKK